MKRGLSKITVFLTACSLFLSVWTLGGCSLSYKLDDDGRFSMGYSKKNAFASVYYWKRGEDKTITVPDEYKGRKITALGGYIGTGVPCPFGIELCDIPYDWRTEELDFRYGQIDASQCEDLVFTVVLGKYIKKIYRIDDGNFTYCGTETTMENGQPLYIVLYKVTCNFIVSEENPYLYAVDGILYSKKTNKPITE